MKRPLTITLLGLLLLGATACGNAAASNDTTADPGAPAAGACPVGTPDCVDTDFGSGRIDVDAAREEARGLLGRGEGDLPADVRVSRRGTEQLILTEDYVEGRRTVELDDTDGNGLRVVRVTVELPAGPETFDLQAG